MASKTLYSDRYGSLTLDLRDNGDLRITASEEYTSVEFNIPAEHVKEIAEKFTEIVTAPAWTRAKFVRVSPEGYPSYTMVADGNNTWKSEHGTTHYTDSFLHMDNEIDFEVIA